MRTNRFIFVFILFIFLIIAYRVTCKVNYSDEEHNANVEGNELLYLVHSPENIQRHLIENLLTWLTFCSFYQEHNPCDSILCILVQILIDQI